MAGPAAVHARCTVSDITMQKIFPAGDPERNNFATAWVRFSLPEDCPAVTPPLEFCVTVWDSSPCKSSAGAKCEGGNYVGSAGSGGEEWEQGGYGTLCTRDMLREFTTGGVTRVSTRINMSVDQGAGIGYIGSPQRYISLVMYNPTRHLVIPIKEDLR